MYVLGTGLGARAQAVEVTSTGSTLDFAGIKKDLAVFQGVLDATLRQSLPGPFPILGSIKGTYLPEYGAVFSLEINVYQIRQLSPFDLRPHTEKELKDAHQQMLNRIELVKSQILKVLGEYGSSLEQLNPDDNLTVVVHLFSGGREARQDLPSQLIFNAKKSFIREYRETKLSLDQFAKNVRLLQF